MGKWEEVKISEVITFSGGSQPPKSTFSYSKKDNYIRLIQIRDYKSDKHIVYIPKDKAKKFCQKDDVMIGRYGPPVFQILKGIEGAYNVALMKAIPNEDELSKDYMFWFLSSPSIQNYIVGLSQRSAGQSGVNKVALEDYLILLPPLTEQKKIVAKLDELFERIDKSISLLVENIQHTKDLMASVLDEEFKPINNDELTIKKLGDVITLQRGYDLPKRLREKGEFPLYGANGIIDYHKDYKVEGEGVCTGRSGSIGLMHYEKNNFWPLNTSLYVKEFKSNLPEYIYYLLRSISIKIKEKAAYAAVPTLDRKKAHEILVNIHVVETQQKVIDKLKKEESIIHNLVSQQTEKLNHLKSLKSSLLDKAFKGELV